LAPGDEALAGIMVSPISFKSFISSSVNASSLTSDLQEDKKTSVPIMAPGSTRAMEDKKCLLFIMPVI
jgi:hypothetical protein